MPTGSRLFSPFVLGRARLRNRLVLEALPSGLTTPVGLPTPELVDYYAARARGGVAALVIEPLRVTPPPRALAHLGLYSEAHTPAMHDCIGAIKREDCAALLMIDEPPAADSGDLTALADACVLAARRARIADADGVMFATGDTSLFRRLAEPQAGAARLAALTHVAEAIIGLLGRRFVVGVRLAIEEHLPGGLSLTAARHIARRLTGAGVNLIEVDVRVPDDMPVAHFPGWCVPVASAVRAAVDVPVLATGQLDDALTAEATIAEGSADLVGVGERLRAEPEWPDAAWRELSEE